MTYYNTNIDVKYHNIEQDLLEIVATRPKNYKPIGEDEHVYTKEDVLDICQKLFNDEVEKVFFEDGIFNMNQMSMSLSSLYHTMIHDIQFKQFFTTLIQNVLENYIGSDRTDIYMQNQIMMQNLHQDIFATLFSQQLFHLTHIIISNKLTNTSTSTDMYAKLTIESIKVIDTNFSH